MLAVTYQYEKKQFFFLVEESMRKFVTSFYLRLVYSHHYILNFYTVMFHGSTWDGPPSYELLFINSKLKKINIISSLLKT